GAPPHRAGPTRALGGAGRVVDDDRGRSDGAICRREPAHEARRSERGRAPWYDDIMENYQEG
ncbi:MAG TPA: hypothetical protein RMF84_20775, partial [Polyangiaceae bacterium LLY-WYZ-14_1]|nr:hypothetical protein [Polyangiaceae bacterium LLY-WYZ-14_1]